MGDLNQMPIGDFIARINTHYKLEIPKEKLAFSVRVLQEQWFNYASDMGTVDHEAFQFLEIPPALRKAILDFFAQGASFEPREPDYEPDHGEEEHPELDHHPSSHHDDESDSDHGHENGGLPEGNNDGPNRPQLDRGLDALKNMVDHMCQDGANVSEFDVESLKNLLIRGMQQTESQMTREVLREMLRRVNAIAPEVAAPPNQIEFEEPLSPVSVASSSSSSSSSSSVSGAPRCELCHDSLKKPFQLACSHVMCRDCLHSEVMGLVSQKRAVGIRCPANNHTCPRELDTEDIRKLLGPDEFSIYLEATLMAFIEQDSLTFVCPNEKCKWVISLQPPEIGAVPDPMTETDADGKPLTAEAWLHFSEFRIRCRSCETVFCAKCKVVPYHKGFTCNQWVEYQNARHCRFCQTQLTAANCIKNPPAPTLKDVCTEDECGAKLEICCDKLKACGCPCNGVKDEATCLPCLKHDEAIGEDYCPICFVEDLNSAPCIKMTGPCTHTMHFACVKAKIEARWSGARVTFSFRECPVCKQKMMHPMMIPFLAPVLELEKIVEEKALARLAYEGREKDPAIVNKNAENYNDPVGFAMKIYLFYICNKCKKPYFAGGYQCQEANVPYDPAELVCPGCQPSSVDDCPEHGKDWLAYKCRYCCNYAAFHCWGNCHFCDKCHKTGVWQTLAVFRTGKNKRQLWEYPQCPGLKAQIDVVMSENPPHDDRLTQRLEALLADPAQCPLGVKHPPNGIEFGLGCSMCDDKMENAHAAASKERARQDAASLGQKLQTIKTLLEAQGSKGKVFQYHHDFDNNGVLYFLATCGGSQPWTNPADAGFLKITSSSIMADSEPLSAAVGREVVRCVTKPVRNSWFCFDLLTMTLAMTHYTLRHYSSWDTECLRFWVLEGSNDGFVWDCIAQHNNDMSLNKKGATKTWAVSDKKRYRMFRILQTGRNSNNNYYLAISGLEFYGTLYNEAPVAKAGGGRVFTYRSDFDTNGILYWLGTRCGESQTWQNPADLELVRVGVSINGSTPQNPCAPINAIVGRDVVRCVTAARPDMWFVIDLKDKFVVPSHYTLRHYSSWDLEALRNWHFQGSVDGQEWVNIRSHRNDQALNRKGASYTWPVDARGQAYSMFRILQFGENSNGHHFLALSGFELYGTVLEMKSPVADAGGAGPDARVSLQYAYDFDTNGLFYWLGTKGKTRPWTNPAVAGSVVVSSSMLAGPPNPSHPASAIVGREVVRCVSAPKPNMWFCVDLCTRKINPTHYTLRHYNTWDTEALRNWKLEGSLDGRTWDVLRQHFNDKALNLKGASHTWTLSVGKNEYRYFRIVQTGPNSNNNHYLSLSGFELYGTVADLSAPPLGVQQALPAPVVQQAPAIMQASPGGPLHQVGSHHQLPVAQGSFHQPQLVQGGGGSFNKAIPQGAVVMGAPVAVVPQGQPLPQQGPAPPPYSPPLAIPQSPSSGRISMGNIPAPNSPKSGKDGGLEFTYSSDFDTNGIIYYLGTNCATQPWQNPGMTGVVTVLSSPLAEDPPSAPAWAITGRDVVRCVTKAGQDAFFSVDLGKWWVKPTAYTLRHYSTWDTEALRDWKLQGSNDGKKWTKLLSHKKDTSLAKKGQSKTWLIPKTDKAYRMFKILQTGKNSNGHWYCALSGFELYGRLYPSPR